MSELSSAQIGSEEQRGRRASADLAESRQGILTGIAAWVNDRNVPFLLISIGMIVMLLWAGLFKMTAPGAEAMTPLVTHSPLIGWQFKLFGPYIGADIIGLTELTAALLFIVGYFKAQAGVIGALITACMFFITSSMIVTTPGAVISYHVTE